MKGCRQLRLLAHIKGDLDFNRGLYNLIDALGKMAVSQYYVLEKKNKSFDKLSIGVETIFGMIDVSISRSPFVAAANSPRGVIAVTSDSGLLGGLNMQVMNLAAKEVREQDARLIVVGEKGRLYAEENNLVCTSFGGINDEARRSQALQVRDYIINEVSSARLGPVKIIYPYSVSIISQKVQILTLLPVSVSADKTKTPADIILESKVDEVIEYLSYIVTGNKLYDIFGLARLAELSARFMHLENSKTRLEELNKQLRLQYFRQKHELTDRNMRELFAARLAFR